MRADCELLSTFEVTSLINTAIPFASNCYQKQEETKDMHGLNSMPSGFFASTLRRRMRSAMLASMLTLVTGALVFAEGAAETKQANVRLIGATTVVTEVSSGLPFAARVDTGATSCSIHCETYEIKDPDPDPRVNIGKPVRFLIKKEDGKAEWVEAKIVDHVTVRTSESEDERYKVSLRLRCEDVEKKVHVTLNDRQSMKYPLLLGRNFLRDDFLVNVGLEKTEP